MCLFSLNFDVNFLSQSRRNLVETMFKIILKTFELTWDLALKRSFTSVRVFMLPEVVKEFNLKIFIVILL